MYDLTIEELKEQIVSRWDTVDLLDVLEISIEDLVSAFSDKIEDQYEQILEELGGDFGED